MTYDYIDIIIHKQIYLEKILTEILLDRKAYIKHDVFIKFIVMYFLLTYE